MLESSPTIHEELGRLRHADRLDEAHELLVAGSAAPVRQRHAGATLRRVRDAVAAAMHASSRPPRTPVTHH